MRGNAEDNPMLWLPLKRRYTRGNKTTILVIPGAAHMDRSQLEEIIQWQEEKIDKEVVGTPVSTMDRREVSGMLNEFLDWRRKRGR